MDDSFQVSSLKDALVDVSNALNKNTEASAIARQKGWVAPEDYNYEKYIHTTQEKPTEPTEFGTTVENVENGENGENGAGPEDSAPQWAANAAKYEWNDEYGDVGPKNPHLEEQLFRSEFINRTGLKIGK